MANKKKNDDFMAKFRAGFKGTDRDEEALELQEEAQEKKKDNGSMFQKIYKKVTGRK